MSVKAGGRSGRRKLVALTAVFVVPLLLAFSSYYWSWPFSPAPDSRGELLTPIKPLPEFAGVGRAGERFTLDDLRGRWWLLVAGDGDCKLHCAADLFKARQVRRALGRERTRVRTAYVSGAHKAGERLNAVLGRHADMRLVLAAGDLAARMPRHGVYIVDPNGNLVLYYAHGAAAGDIKRDLHRLLKASRIG